MINFEIKVDCKGNAAGTLGWLNEILKNSEIVIKNSKQGVPAMFMKNNKTDKYKYICNVSDNERDLYGEFNVVTCSYGDSYVTLDCVHPTNAHEPEYMSGLFTVPLTPATHEKVEQFLEKCRNAFAQWWITDGKEKVESDGINVSIN